jgi:predicted nucleotidyltransferase
MNKIFPVMDNERNKSYISIRGINLSEEKLKEICLKNQVKELSIFGSALREDFNSNSDIDLLVTFSDTAQNSLFDIVRIKEEFENFLERPVDLVNRKAVEESKNIYRKKAILESAKVIYAA